MFINTAESDRASVLPRLSRNATIVVVVLLLHAVGLWALNNGLLRRAVEIIVPVQILAQLIEPPKPVEPPPPPPVVPPKPVQQKAPKLPEPTPPPPPQIQPVANPDPAPTAPTAIATPPAPLPPITVPQAVVPAPVAVAPPPPPAPPRVELPSSNADYLQNPKPAYPSLSRKLREEGSVVFRVFVGVDGNPQKIEISKSSGYDRLDQAALASVEKWRFVPGKRAGVVEPMWVVFPIEFGLSK